MTDRIPGAPGRCKAVVTGQELQKLHAGEEFAITLRRDDQPIQEGTPYSKAAVLPDAVAAKLCPGVQDPTPGDAFAALQSQKADAVRRNVGRSITLCDATHTPLKGLCIFGQGQDTALVGDAGSIAVSVAGKNQIDYRKAYARNTGESVTVDESLGGVHWTGTYWFYIPVSIPAGTAVRFSCESECSDNPDNVIHAFHLGYEDDPYGMGDSTYCENGYPATAAKDVKKIYIRRSQVDSNETIKIWNMQLELGTAVTEYEPYQEPQTLTVPTAAGTQVGLAGDGNVYDEINFEKGVLIHRVFEEQEYPLPEEVLKAYAKLHTYTPTTVITNNAGAEMGVTYYTTTTAVQMVHSPADKGKTFTIDKHGCVTLTRDNPVIACGETAIDGVTWYYRKWADGFAECWTKYVVSHDTVDNTDILTIVLPFSVRGKDDSSPNMYFRFGCPYEWVLTDVPIETDVGAYNVSLRFPEYVVDDEYIGFEADVYITGYWYWEVVE